MYINKLIKILFTRLDVTAIALQKIIQGIVGLIIALLISTHVNLEYQGYFYTLVNLSAAYTLFDLGLSGLMVQVSASFFAKSKILYSDLKKQNLNNIFIDLIAWSRRYFFTMSLFTLIFIPIGYLFFLKSSSASSVNIVLIPLIMTIALSAFSIPAIAILSVIEGVGKINESYGLRIVISIIGALLAASLILSENALFAAGMIPLSTSLVSYSWAYIKYKNIFCFRGWSIKHRSIHWKVDLDFLRNKVKVTSIAVFIFQSGPTLFFFYFFSPHKAGQIGLSSSFLGIGSFICSSFFIAKIPELARLISSEKINDAKLLFIFEFKRALILTLAGYFTLLAFIYLLRNYDIGTRFLSPADMTLLIFNFITIHLVTLINSYSRCYGEEVMAKPFFFATTVGILISILMHAFLDTFGMLLILNISYLLICFPMIIKYFSAINKPSGVLNV